MMEYRFDAEKTKHELVTWIRQFFDENGPGLMQYLEYQVERTAPSRQPYA